MPSGHAVVHPLGRRSRRVCAGPYGRAESDVEVDMRWLPSIVVLAVLVLAAPLWPWSRGWSWVPAGMIGVTLGTIVLFTLSVAPG